MSVQFLMIPILTRTPPTPVPHSCSFASTELEIPRPTAEELASRVEPHSILTQARSDVKEIVRNYLQGGGGGRGTLPFTNFEVVEQAQYEMDVLTQVGTKSMEEMRKIRGRSGWNARRRADKAKKVLRVDQKLESALSGLGW
ncbi:hypothetical protein JCM3765_001171 [Sporobolomyces pararoseus]